MQLDDGLIEECTANIVAESSSSQVDSEGNHHMLICDVIDHMIDNTEVKTEDSCVEKNGAKVPKKTTKGWHLLVKWKDGLIDWAPS